MLKLRLERETQWKEECRGYLMAADAARDEEKTLSWGRAFSAALQAQIDTKVLIGIMSGYIKEDR
ncbi:MAG: hypothetical protein FJ271_33135 [Planctomycetes bacterium]|nr:hypothetical protein [Planctomycetota bacterium]